MMSLLKNRSVQDSKDDNQKVFFEFSAQKSKSENPIPFFSFIPKAHMQDTDGKIKMPPHFMFNHFLLLQLLYYSFH